MAFSQQLTANYAMDPATGQIINIRSGQVYANAEQLNGQSQYDLTTASMQGSQGGGASSGSNAASSLGTAASLGYGAYTSGLFGSAAAGAGSTALAGSGAVAGSTAVGSSIGGGTMLASGAVAPMTAGTSTAAAGGAAGVGAGSVASVAGPLAAVIAAYMAAVNYENQRKASGGELSREDISTMTHMFGMPKPLRKFQSNLDKIPFSPTGLGYLAFGASRQKQEQGARKVGRRVLQDVGLLGPDSRSIYSTADGTGFDIREFKERTGTDAYNLDWNSNIDSDKLGFLQAITNAAMGSKPRKESDVKKGKTSGDLSAELYNAANSGGKLNENTRFYGDTLGGRDAIYSAIANNWKNEIITAEERDMAFAAIDKEYGIVNKNNSRWEDSQNLSDKENRRNVRELTRAQEKEGNSGLYVPGKAPMAPAAASKAPLVVIPGTQRRPESNAPKNPYLKGNKRR